MLKKTMVSSWRCGGLLGPSLETMVEFEALDEFRDANSWMIRYVEKNWHDNDGDVHMATSHKPIWAMIVLTDFDALGLPYSEGRQLSQCFVSKNIRKLSPQTCSDVEVLMATCDMCPSIFV